MPKAQRDSKMKVSVSFGRVLESLIQGRQGGTVSEAQGRKRSLPAGGIKESFLEEGNIDPGLKLWCRLDHQSIIDNFYLTVKIFLK